MRDERQEQDSSSQEGVVVSARTGLLDAGRSERENVFEFPWLHAKRKFDERLEKSVRKLERNLTHVAFQQERSTTDVAIHLPQQETLRASAPLDELDQIPPETVSDPLTTTLSQLTRVEGAIIRQEAEIARLEDTLSQAQRQREDLELRRPRGLGRVMQLRRHGQIVRELGAKEEERQNLQTELAAEKRTLDENQIRHKNLQGELEEASVEAVEGVISEMQTGANEVLQRFSEDKAIRAELDQALIKAKLQPDLEKMQQAGDISPETVAQMPGLVKDFLAQTTTQLPEKALRDYFLTRLTQSSDAYRIIPSMSNIFPSYMDSPTSGYETMLDFLLRNEERASLEDLETFIRQAKLPEALERQLSESVDNALTPTAIYRRKQTLAIDQIPPTEFLDKFMNRSAWQRWEILRENPSIQATFGRESVLALDKMLGEKCIVDIAHSLTSHGRGSEDSSRNLLQTKHPDLVPISVINAWRERGNSQFPLRAGFGNQQLKDTELFAYVSSLTETELEATKAIPGIASVIRLIKENQEALCHYRGNDPRRLLIEDELLKTGIYFLEKGDDDQQVIAFGLIQALEVPITEAAPAILAFIQNASDDQARDRILFDLQARQDELLDLETTKILLASYESLPEEMREAIKEKAPELFKTFLYQEEVDQATLANFSKAMGKTEDALRAVIKVVHGVNPAQRDVIAYHFEPEKFDAYVQLSQHQDFLPFMQKLAGFGFEFFIDDASIIEEMLDHKEEILSGIDHIRTIFPDFKYHFTKSKAYDPYRMLAEEIPAYELLQTLAVGEVAINGFSRGLLQEIRMTEVWERTSSTNFEAISEDTYYHFNQAVESLTTSIFGGQEQNHELTDFYSNKHFLRFLSHHPGRIGDLLAFPQVHVKFLSLIADDGKLHFNRDNFIREIFSDGDPFHRAAQVEKIFTQDVAYWETLYEYTIVRLGAKLDASDSNFPVTNIAGVDLERLAQDVNASEEQTQLATIITDPQVREDILQKKRRSVPFVSLAPEYKRLVFRDYLQRAIETSNAREAKRAANERNRKHADEQLQLEPGMYIHATAIDNLPPILRIGNLPQEALGEQADVDFYPFHVDFSRLTGSHLSLHPEVKDAINTTVAAREKYGTGGKFQKEGKIYLAYRRSGTTWEPDKEYSAGEGGVVLHEEHALQLGAYPATELSEIILHNPQVALEDAKQFVIENGFYVPIYDEEGNRLFTPEEFDIVQKQSNTIEGVFVSDMFEPARLLRVLGARVPLLAEYYPMDTGNVEHESLETHTLKAMENFEENFAQRWTQELLEVISLDDMRITVALHDIGKPLANLPDSNITQEDGENLDATTRQHRLSKEIVEKSLRELGYEQEAIAKSVAIIDQDFIGEFMQRRISAREAAEGIDAIAARLGKSRETVFRVLEIYYLCDAGSYDALDNLFNRIPATEGIQTNLTFSQTGERKFAALRDEYARL